MQRRNKNIVAGWALLGATVAVGGVTLATTARAQEMPATPATPAPGQEMQPMPGTPGAPGAMGGEAPFPFPRRGGETVITANDRFVFVLRGSTLYKMDVADLRLLAQTQLPPPGAPGGMNAPPINEATPPEGAPGATPSPNP